MKSKNALAMVFTLSLSLISSCGRDYKPLPVDPDEVSSSGSPGFFALPSNSVGVTETVDPADNHKFDIVIPASKTYNPSTFNDGWYFIDQSSEFELAETIDVLSGRAGNHLAFLTITRSEVDNGLPKNLNCVYVGQESGTPADHSAPAAEPYKFDFCTEGSVSITEANYTTLKAGPENILDATERAGWVLTFKRGDRVAIQVNNGNDESTTTQYIPTEVEYRFKKTNL